MENQMFCYQCEQTAACRGCTGKAGVCGKTAATAALQDQLTGALIGLARATDGGTTGSADDKLVQECLFATLTNVNFDDEALRVLMDRVHAEKQRIVPDCATCENACGRTADYDMQKLWNAQEDIRSLKSLILFGIRGVAAYAYHAGILGYRDEAVNQFLYKALFALGEDWGMAELLPIVMEVGEKNLTIMALLDRANTETYGTPAPVTVPLTIEKGSLDAILSNPPYIRTEVVQTLAPELFYEPSAALDGGGDGLDFYRAILRLHTPLLRPQGFMLFEIGYDQGEDLRRLSAEYGFDCRIVRDLGGCDRVAVLTRREPGGAV